jgi:hypothetical protein
MTADLAHIRGRVPCLWGRKQSRPCPRALGVDLDKGVVHIVSPAPAFAPGADHDENHKRDDDRDQGSR